MGDSSDFNFFWNSEITMGDIGGAGISAPGDSAGLVVPE